jgi:hypothetical protein
MELYSLIAFVAFTVVITASSYYCFEESQGYGYTTWQLMVRVIATLIPPLF